MIHAPVDEVEVPHREVGANRLKLPSSLSLGKSKDQRVPPRVATPCVHSPSGKRTHNAAGASGRQKGSQWPVTLTQRRPLGFPASVQEQGGASPEFVHTTKWERRGGDEQAMARPAASGPIAVPTRVG